MSSVASAIRYGYTHRPTEGPMTLLVNLDKLPVGSRWREPHGGDRYRKISPYSHRNERTGELVFDVRLYGVEKPEPAYVEEVQA